MIRKLLFICFLLVFVLPLAAHSLGISLTLQGGSAFAFPHADYLKQDESLVFRTSSSYLVDMEFLEVTLDTRSNSAVDFALGYSLGYVGQSLPYGSSILRAYRTQGPEVRLSYIFDNHFGIGIKARYLRGEFPASKSYFQTQDYEIVPSYRVWDRSKTSISFVAPLTVSFKADTVTLRFSLGTHLWLGAKGIEG